MKKLLVLILCLVLSAAVIPAGAQVGSGPYPAPTGHALGDGPEGSGARVEVITRPDVKLAKPRPTATPEAYPQPAPEMQAEAYPAPGEGLPGVEMYSPDDPDPRPGIPYVWGIFFDSGGDFVVYVSIDLGYPAFDLEGGACIMSTAAPYAVTCYDLNPRYYRADLGRTMYTSDRIRHCGHFVVQAADLEDIPADIREPNLYALRCVFLPWLRRYWY
jgi:hypothetical protein